MAEKDEQTTAVASPQPFPNGQLDPRLLLNALVAVKNGDFAMRLPTDWTGINGKIADAFNDIVALEEKLAQEMERASRVVGQEGKITHRVSMGRVSGGWSTQVESLNNLIGDLV